MQFKAIIEGWCVMAMIQVLTITISQAVPSEYYLEGWFLALQQLIAALIFVVPAFVTGYRSKKRPALNTIIMAGLGLAAVLGYSNWDESSSNPFWIIQLWIKGLAVSYLAGYWWGNAVASSNKSLFGST